MMHIHHQTVLDLQITSFNILSLFVSVFPYLFQAGQWREWLVHLFPVDEYRHAIDLVMKKLQEEVKCVIIISRTAFHS